MGMTRRALWCRVGGNWRGTYPTAELHNQFGYKRLKDLGQVYGGDGKPELPLSAMPIWPCDSAQVCVWSPGCTAEWRESSFFSCFWGFGCQIGPGRNFLPYCYYGFRGEAGFCLSQKHWLPPMLGILIMVCDALPAAALQGQTNRAYRHQERFYPVVRSARMVMFLPSSVVGSMVLFVGYLKILDSYFPALH